jgi:methylenetetrahydrofolate dehydrogenase (NADP+)/methenyltetrahydrofolate cyclohydrolase
MIKKWQFHSINNCFYVFEIAKIQILYLESTMSTVILDGKLLAEKKKVLLKQDVDNFQTTYHKSITLAVILVGNDPASSIYVNHKQKACQAIGISSKFISLDSHISQAELLSVIDSLNHDPTIHGILVQLPLPSHISKDKIIQSISVNKDVDGFHPYNTGLLAQGLKCLRPCTPKGVMELLSAYDLLVKSKNAVIVGASNIVGRPMAWELLKEYATPTICHRKTKNLKRHIEQADIVISATGNREAVNSDWLQPGQIVIDVGIHRLPSGKLCGDIDFEKAVSKGVAAITPVPGGVGPMTVVCLLENTIQAALEMNAGVQL